MLRARRWLPATALLSLALLAPSARAFEAWDGRAQLHGFWRTDLRALADGYDPELAYLSQLTHILNLELELELAPLGVGPFDRVGAFARVEVRYECVYTGCGLLGTHDHFGDRADHAPARNWTDGVTTGFRGDVRTEPPERVHGGGTELLPLTSSPRLEPLFEAGATNVEGTLGPLVEDVFAFKKVDGTRADESMQLGPWRPESEIVPNGALADRPNRTLPLALRPSVADADPRVARGLYVPSAPLREAREDFDDFDQNFSQNELEWNHGGGQDEHELKELYLDLDALDGRLWLRLGKQNIVWGKTELFRTTDQMNPQDIGLVSLPSLEESRLPLWSARAVYSFYDVGPLQDVRVEAAVNLDDFEPTDLGRCGEPYTVWLVCGKSGGLWAHGFLGVGLAGEERPADPWDDVKGLEGGVRVEFRWGRFSFALTDFYGYADTPVVEALHFYERRVDPGTGRPLDVNGELLTPQNALAFQPGNRQFFDLTCSISVGIAAELLAELGDRCILDVPNADAVLAGIGTTPSEALAAVVAGQAGGEVVAQFLLTGGFGAPPSPRLTPLVKDAADGPGAGFFDSFFGADSSLSEFLSPQQEALLGCGPFYGTNCDTQGIDLFNAEASVLVQSFPNAETGMPVATRYVNGELVVLPGALGPGDAGYDASVDGTPPPGFDSELAAFSANFATLMGIFSIAGGNDPDCRLDALVRCDLVRAVLAVTGVQRPEARAGGNGRFGRRDFQWHGGGEAVLRYPKRNVLGFSTDFAEDLTKTNWSLEFTWIDDAVYGSRTSRSRIAESDAYNLTVSVDRPTFVSFLNAGRTFFMNAQVFFGYRADWNSGFDAEGPWSVLGTFSVATGYFQDRLLPSLTFVHDLRSASGGSIGQVQYRFTQSFSATFGFAVFYGGPEPQPLALHPFALGNEGGDFSRRRRYGGLSPLAERDELFVSVRYTF